MWVDADVFECSEIALQSIVAVVAARVKSFGTQPHALGPVGVAARHVTRRKLSQLRGEASEGKWRAGKTQVIHLGPLRKGAVQCEEVWSERVSQMHKHQEELRRRIRDMPADHEAYDWMQQTATKMKPIFFKICLNKWCVSRRRRRAVCTCLVLMRFP